MMFHREITLTWGPVCLTLSWDIALLRLSTDATLNNYVQLASLPPSGQVLPHDNPCYITGWGRTQSECGILINNSVQYLHAKENQYENSVRRCRCRSVSWLIYICLLSSAGGQLSAQLKQAYLPVVDYKTCTSYGWWGSTVKDSMVCAGGGSDSGCQVSWQCDELFHRWTV